MVGVTDRNKSKADWSIGPRKKTWFGQKDFRRVFIGYQESWVRMPIFQFGFERGIWLASQLKLSKDAARVNEYFQEWCDVILDVDKQINKQAQADLIEAQWDTIPFQILHSNQFENLLKLGK